MTDKIKYLMESFSASAPDRVKYIDNKLSIKGSGNTIVDILSAIIFFPILALNTYFIYKDGFTYSVLEDFVLTFGILFGLFYIYSRGDNRVTCDFSKNTLRIKRRSFLLCIIPAQTISFNNIDDFFIKADYGPIVKEVGT